jgi:uncharacterized membrane protein YdjX (TVP38/TMEM64 family)
MNDPSTPLTQERKFARWNKYGKLTLLALFFVIVIIVSENFDLAELRELIAQNPDLIFLISFAAIFITGLTLVIPTAPVTLFIAVLIGPLPAIVISILGNMITALVHYQLGKQIGDVVNFEEKKAKLPFKLGKLPVNSPLFLLIGRGLPGGPKGFSFVCGAYGVPLFLYVWTTFVTEFIGSVLIAFGGDELIKRI